MTSGMRDGLGLIAGLAVCAAAFGQPEPFNELGALPQGRTRISNVQIDGVIWFRFSIPGAADAAGSFLDITTDGNPVDSEIALYDGAGNRIAVDLDDGKGALSSLSFGSRTARPPVRGGLAPDGRDGELAAGVYYLVVSHARTVFLATDWQTFIAFEDVDFMIYDVVIDVGVTPPPPPDAWFERGEAGELPGTAQRPAGDGPLARIRGVIADADVDMYAVTICSPAAFSATTVGGAGFDTRLWLFYEDGPGIAVSDDSGGSPQSTLTGAFVPAPGLYYLAVAAGPAAPLDEFGSLLWNDAPRDVERSPDGPGAEGDVTSWSEASFGGAYEILLTGVCFPGTPLCSACSADFDGSGGVDGDDIGAFFLDWQRGGVCADVDGSGGVDGADIGVFFAAWQAGCP